MNLPKVRSVVADPANPDENRLVLLRIQNEGKPYLQRICWLK